MIFEIYKVTLGQFDKRRDKQSGFAAAGVNPGVTPQSRKRLVHRRHGNAAHGGKGGDTDKRASVVAVAVREAIQERVEHSGGVVDTVRRRGKG